MTSEPAGGGADPAVTVEVESVGGRVLVRVRGELDLSTAPVLHAALGPHLAASEPETLVFDASGLAFMDSSGIAVLLEAVARGKTVHVREPPPVVREVLAAAGLEDVLGVDGDGRQAAEP